MSSTDIRRSAKDGRLVGSRTKARRLMHKQNTIRRNLPLHNVFVKVSDVAKDGKGEEWTFDSDNGERMRRTAYHPEVLQQAEINGKAVGRAIVANLAGRVEKGVELEDTKMMVIQKAGKQSGDGRIKCLMEAVAVILRAQMKA
jgi:hypothetical protein